MNEDVTDGGRPRYEIDFTEIDPIAVLEEVQRHYQERQRDDGDILSSARRAMALASLHDTIDILERAEAVAHG